MTNKPARITAPTMRRLVDRVLDTPELVRAVRDLPPRTLAKLVDAIGLEDAGELLALASTEQVVRVLDEDLWRSEAPGRDEAFDLDRFGIWLEILLEAGAPFAARQLASWPEELVTLALCESLLVIDLDAWALALDGGGEELDAVERALDRCPCHEFGGHMLIARRPEGFDLLVDLLTALDDLDHALFDQLMDRLCSLSSDVVDDSGGLAETLSAEEMAHEDAAAEREERRAAEGYLAPSSALAFLRLIRETPLEELIAGEGSDPVSRAYFRRYDAEAAAAASRVPDRGAAADLIGLLQKAGVLRSGQRRPQLPVGGLFRQSLWALGERDWELGERLSAELAFLANALVAGLAREGRSYRPAEAADAVIGLCERGLELLLERTGEDPAWVANLVRDAGAIKLFKIGFRLDPDRRGPT